MSKVDADYWKKCIEHQKKEILNYMILDGVIVEESQSETETAQVSEISVPTEEPATPQARQQ